MAAKKKKKTINRFRPQYNLRQFHKGFLDDPEGKVIAFCDTETEGLDCMSDHIIQFSVIKYRIENGQLVRGMDFDTYIRTPDDRPLSDIIVKKIGITDQMLQSAPTEAEVFPLIKRIMSDVDIFAAYNEPFDYGFVSQMYRRQGSYFNPSVRFDVMAMAHDLITMRECNSKSLGKVAGYLKVKTGEEQLHNAFEDISLTVKVFEKLFDKYVALPIIDRSSFPTPRPYNYWFWQNPNNYLYDRIYFATSCGKIFFEKKDRSFGCDTKEKAYNVDELNLDDFVPQALRLTRCKTIEDLAHLQAPSPT